MSKKTCVFSRCTKEKYLAAFLLGALCLLLPLLPIMISNHGYFIYCGDYNAQQIPFYNMANDTVRSGGTFGLELAYRSRIGFYDLLFLLPVGKPFFLALCGSSERTRNILHAGSPGNKTRYGVPDSVCVHPAFRPQQGCGTYRRTSIRLLRISVL